MGDPARTSPLGKCVVLVKSQARPYSGANTTPYSMFRFLNSGVFTTTWVRSANRPKVHLQQNKTDQRPYRVTFKARPSAVPGTVLLDLRAWSCVGQLVTRDL